MKECKWFETSRLRFKNNLNKLNNYLKYKYCAMLSKTEKFPWVHIYKVNEHRDKQVLLWVKSENEIYLIQKIHVSIQAELGLFITNFNKGEDIVVMFTKDLPYFEYNVMASSQMLEVATIHVQRTMNLTLHIFECGCQYI